MIESTIVPVKLRARYKTVSEALLDLTEDEISHLHLNAPFLCTPKQRIIVPVSPIVTSKESDFIGIREHMLEEILKSDKSTRSNKLESLFPPKGNVGFWDVGERIYRTRYMEK